MRTPLIVRPGDRWLSRLFDDFNDGVDRARQAIRREQALHASTARRLHTQRYPEPTDPGEEGHAVKSPNTVRLDVMHASMNHDMNVEESRSDAGRIMRRAQDDRVAWISGTEAAPNQKVRPALVAAAAQYNRRFVAERDVWLAVDNSRVEKGSWGHGYIQVVDSQEGQGRHTDKGLLWASWQDTYLGKRVSVSVAHFLTKGAEETDPNYGLNSRLIRTIGDWGKSAGAGGSLAFFAGDTNINDKKFDVFRGRPFTTVQDELGQHPNTGHGPIDVVASYDKDGRVTAAYVRALNDRQFHLNTDHFVLEAGFDIRLGK